MKPIPFFLDTITLLPHTATAAHHIGRPVSIREFANGEPVGLYLLENGEYLVQSKAHLVGPGRFIEGKEYVY